MSAPKKRMWYCACPRGCRVRVYRTLTCDYCTYACAVNEDGALSEDPQTYSGYVAIFSTEGARVMAVEAMGACECLCCRDDADAGGGADDDHADAGGGAAPRRRAQDYAAGARDHVGTEVAQRLGDELKTLQPEPAPQRERAIVEAELQDAEAKLQATYSDPQIDVATIMQMREAAQRLCDELQTLRFEPMPASCTGLLYCCLLYNVK